MSLFVHKLIHLIKGCPGQSNQDPASIQGKRFIWYAKCKFINFADLTHTLPSLQKKQSVWLSNVSYHFSRFSWLGFKFHPSPHHSSRANIGSVFFLIILKKNYTCHLMNTSICMVVRLYKTRSPPQMKPYNIKNKRTRLFSFPNSSAMQFNLPHGGWMKNVCVSQRAFSSLVTLMGCRKLRITRTNHDILSTGPQ